MSRDLLLYGATGFTGTLVAAAAVRQGLRPVLAARSRARLEPLAARLGLPWRSFPLEEPRQLRAKLGGAGTVLNLAGPFSATAGPMIEACLATGANYVDITGEVAVLEETAGRDAAAQAAGVVLLPGAGFDVVPSDCLALHLKRRMPGMARLRLSIAGLTRASRGTKRTAVEALGRGTLVRRGGALVELPTPPRGEADFGSGLRPTVAVSWGDLATAWHSTRAPDIETHFAVSRTLLAFARSPAPVRRALGARPVQATLKALAGRLASGPSEAEREGGEARLLGEAWDASGRRVATRMRTPEPYGLTARTALEVARRVNAGEVAPGFHTPARAFGPDFALGFEGVSRQDV